MTGDPLKGTLKLPIRFGGFGANLKVQTVVLAFRDTCSAIAGSGSSQDSLLRKQKVAHRPFRFVEL